MGAVFALCTQRTKGNMNFKNIILILGVVTTGCNNSDDDKTAEISGECRVLIDLQDKSRSEDELEANADICVQRHSILLADGTDSAPIIGQSVVERTCSEDIRLYSVQEMKKIDGSLEALAMNDAIVSSYKDQSTDLILQWRAAGCQGDR